MAETRRVLCARAFNRYVLIKVIIYGIFMGNMAVTFTYLVMEMEIQ